MCEGKEQATLSPQPCAYSHCLRPNHIPDVLVFGAGVEVTGYHKECYEDMVTQKLRDEGWKDADGN